jgi:mono/diheme cytochrome c family protein
MAAIVFAAVLALTGGYFAFRRTLIPAVAERIIAPDTDDPAAYGRVLFSTRGCTGCHTLQDAGSTGDEGPVLDGIGARRTYTYLRAAIADPSTITDAVCPHGPCQAGLMPVWGRILEPAQIDALAAYLSAQR